MPTVSVEMQVLLAVVTAAVDAEPYCVIRRALDRKLGAGWALEFSSARSGEDRVAVLARRMALMQPTVESFDPLRRDSLKDATSHEDGGAR
jgi:hypothetical protein